MLHCNDANINFLIEHENGLTSNGSPSRDILKNLLNEKKQMTVQLNATGAVSAKESWHSMNWKTIDYNVNKLQMRIAKAYKLGRYGKVRSLQWILTHSREAKLLAVKRVTSTSGAKTPGVDGMVCQTPKQKISLSESLNRRNYKAQPLRRIYIPKKDNQLRPLSIPTIKDRAMQALHLLALEPLAEISADPNSYGFRKGRCVADAIEKCFIGLSRKTSAQWVMEGDIKKCFDNISHEWLMQNVEMDKKILHKWLDAGYLEKDKIYATKEGTPQGGIISPLLANLVLDGMEKIVGDRFKVRSKVHLIRYADDFVITGPSKEILENEVKPLIESFLKERNLNLSETKTKFTHINSGFDFLGFNFRKYEQNLLLNQQKRV